MIIALILIGVLVCIAFSAFFSASEMAISSASKIRMENEAEAGNKKAAVVLKLIEHFDDALSTILIGNNLVNTGASSLASVFVILIAGSDMTWISTIAITILVIIFGESIPKISAKKSANRISLFVSPFINVLRIILCPLVFIVVKAVHVLTSFVKTEDEEDKGDSVRELHSIIETAEDEDVIDEDTSELMQAAIDFNDTSAFEIMTSRVDMESIDADADMKDILEQISESRYSRFPVYKDSIDNIIGVLHINRLYQSLANKEDIDLEDLLFTPVFVYKTMKLPSILKQMRAAKQHLAIVTDEYSGTLGVITFEDVLEEIVGDIWDENDEVEKEIVKKSGGRYEIDGDLTISDFIELVGMPEEELVCDSETVGGYIIEVLEHFPVVGEKIKVGDFVLEVIEAEERRVTKVLVR